MKEVDLDRFNSSVLLLANMVYSVIDNDFPLLAGNQIVAFEASLLRTRPSIEQISGRLLWILWVRVVSFEVEHHIHLERVYHAL
jgi:hypothetical protein